MRDPGSAEHRDPAARCRSGDRDLFGAHDRRREPAADSAGLRREVPCDSVAGGQYPQPDPGAKSGAESDVSVPVWMLSHLLPVFAKTEKGDSSTCKTALFQCSFFRGGDDAHACDCPGRC